MGNTEDGTPTKPEKASSPVQEPSTYATCPDWMSIQAYFATHGVPPSHFYAAAVAPGHAPHPYMWGPQPMLSPYGSQAYAAVYANGGIYAHHSGMPVASNPHAYGASLSGTSEPKVAGVETSAKSSGSKGEGSAKKRKASDGTAASVGNGTSENSGDQMQGQSPSDYSGTEGSSNGSDDNCQGMGRKRNGEEAKLDGNGEQVNSRGQLVVYVGDSNRHMGGDLGVSIVAPTGRVVGGMPLSGMTTGAEFRNLAIGKTKGAASAPTLQASGPVAPTRDNLHPDLWLKDERELKRERRKQSNRESARRSRLRKQAECEELATKVESVAAENQALRDELDRLKETIENLKSENSLLLEKLEKAEDEPRQQVTIENLLSKMGSSSQNKHESEAPDKPEKLHQLLEANARTDAVAAG